MSERVFGLVVPHAGLMYSGPVAAWAYRAVQGADIDVVVLVGPSHRVGFEGVALYPKGAFSTPLGPIPIDADVADAIRAAAPVVHDDVAAHAPEHSLEMQLPFLRRVLPDTPIVPLLMGYQSSETIDSLGGRPGRRAGRAPGAARGEQRPVALPRRANRGASWTAR